MSNAAKNFGILAISSSVLHNYFASSTKLFSDLYLAKFLDTSVKLFFLRSIYFYTRLYYIKDNFVSNMCYFENGRNFGSRNFNC